MRPPMEISTTVLAMLAAVTTATAIVACLMLVAARRDVSIYKAQVRIANDTAEGDVRTAQRMQQALRVVSEEIMKAKADRVAADRVIERAEKMLASGDGLEGLQGAWEDLLNRPPST